jgi:magnesium transporter
MGTLRLTIDRTDQDQPTDLAPERLGEALTEPGTRVWLDLRDPGPEDVALLRRVFGFHELALEDVTRPHDRPRCDTYGGYHFIVVYAAELAGQDFAPRELNVFWGEKYFVTIHRGPAGVLALLDETRRRWERQDGRAAHGVPALVYSLFESLVDGYFAVQDLVRRRIEGIEDAIFKGDERAAGNLFRLRKELLKVPRLLAPTGQILAEVVRRGRALPEALRPYFEDVQDHAVHVLSGLDTYRDLLGAALDTQVFYAFNRLGHIMKRLTAITVIIMVPNFVAGVFGMNFDRILPAHDWPFAFPLVVVLLLGMIGWGFIHSRIMGWL